VGDDANPCSRTAPCKTFAGAISKTAAGGEINALDPGGYGAVTITKSISIISESLEGGVLVSGTNGIIVNDPAAAPNATITVVLRGLDLEGLGTGLSGIKVLNARAVYVEDTTINNFTGGGGGAIDVTSGSPVELYLTNVDARNSQAGLHLKPSGAGSVKATIENSRFTNNTVGLDARDNSRVTIRNSAATGNTNAGLQAQPDAGTAEINAESVVASSNGIGIQAGGAAGVGAVHIANTMVYGNGTGIAIASGSSVVSFTNNMIFGNTSAGNAPTTTPLQ
jgi:hypothetical protein